MARQYNAKYSPDMLKKARQYLQERRDEYKKDEGLTVKLPTSEGLAVYLGVTRKTLLNWKEDNPEWEMFMQELKTAQFTRLVDRGLEGKYNTVIAKLMLTSNHGMKDRSDVTTDDEPLPLFDYAATRNNNRDA